MREFEKLKEVCDRLHGPGGCPWDRQQTLSSIRPYILEEIHELLEGLDEGDPEKILEELGDCFFQLLFCAKLGEIAGYFTLSRVLEGARKKFVGRHPHVFAGVSVRSVEEVGENWERIKGEEKRERKHSLEGIPKTLGSLIRAGKIVQKIMKSDPDAERTLSDHAVRREESEEEEMGMRFLRLVYRALLKGIDPESALRGTLAGYEKRIIKREEEVKRKGKAGGGSRHRSAFLGLPSSDSDPVRDVPARESPGADHRTGNPLSEQGET